MRAIMNTCGDAPPIGYPKRPQCEPRVRQSPKVGAGLRLRRETHIILVEDEADLRCLCADALKRAGFAVVECPTLASAFSALERVAPGIVLLDRELPDGSGFDLASWMRQRSLYEGVPILGFSGRKSLQDVEAALVAGCDAFLGKPFTVGRLVAEISRTLAPGVR
jgi:DNA-binding response OmpR family regulator